MSATTAEMPLQRGLRGVKEEGKRSRSPAIRGRSGKYYAIRAPSSIVGEAHGIHDTWDEAKRWMRHPTPSSVRAAVAPNHKSFPRTPEGLVAAQEYLESRPDIFVSGRELTASARVTLVFVGTVAIFYFINMLNSTLMENLNCSRDYLGMNTMCYYLKKFDVFARDHQAEVYHTFGLAAIGVFSMFVQQVMTFINGGGRF